MSDVLGVHRSAVIVLGAERSGTSVVTEMVHRWGAYAGEPDKLTGPNQHNPQGQWEYEPLWDLLTELGDFASGATWWDPQFEQRIKAKLEIEEFRHKAQTLIAGMECLGRPWVWKDPALCHFLSFWKPIWGDVAYIIVVRNAVDVARSWQRVAVPAHLHDGINLLACNLLRWQHMMLMVLKATDDEASKIFLEYESLVRDPLAQAHRLATFLDQRCGDRASDEQTIQEMAAAVNPALWHNRSSQALSQISEAGIGQQRLYDYLRRKVVDPGEPFVNAYPMPAGWWEFVHDQEAAVRERQ